MNRRFGPEGEVAGQPLSPRSAVRGAATFRAQRNAGKVPGKLGVRGQEMEKTGRRLDRRSFWLWAVPLGLGYVISARPFFFPMSLRVASSLAAVDTILVVFLAITLAQRFRDIGWSAWIGPTILFVTMFGLPFVVVGLEIMHYPQLLSLRWIAMIPMIQTWQACGMLAAPVNLLLLIVAGCVPGRPARTEIAYVFE